MMPETAYFPPHSRFYYKTWLWIYALALLCYAPFFFNFIWGNHDWQWVKEYTPLASGLFEGRFSQFIVQTLLFGGNILPIFTLLAAFAFFSAAAVLLFRLWNLPQQEWIFLLLGLNLVCSPYTLSWLYFAFITLSSFSWVFVVISAYWLLSRRQQSKRPLCLFLASSMLLMLALGGYPPVINLIGVIFCTFVLNDLCLRALSPQSLIRKYLPYALSIALAFGLFLIIQYILKKYHLQYGTYNTAEIAPSAFFAKLRFSAAHAVRQFFTTSSFISYSYKYLGLCLFLLALLRLWRKLPKTAATVALFALALAGLLFSSVITLFAAQNAGYVLNAPRIDFFGLLYIYIFSAAILCKSSSRFIRNLTAAALAYLLFYNFGTAALAGKIWKFGFTAETALAERLLSRIESHPRFIYGKAYTFVQGGTLDFRSRYYPYASRGTPDSYTLTSPYIPWHLPSKAYKFYYPNDFFGADFDIFWAYVSPKELSLSPALFHYLAATSRPWPNAAAVYIGESTVILTLTADGQNRARRWIKSLSDLSS